MIVNRGRVRHHSCGYGCRGRGYDCHGRGRGPSRVRGRVQWVFPTWFLT
jgi:hypothetical protein